MNESATYERRSLLSLAEYINGFAFKPVHLGDYGTPVVRIEQLNNPEGRFDKTTFAPPLKNHIDTGDLVFSWSGTLKVARWKHGHAYLNQHLFKVVPKAGVDHEFLLQLLQQSIVSLSNAAHGSTMKHIQRGELEKFQAYVPTSEKEQRRIADLLSAVDDQIEYSLLEIDKLAALLSGVMQDSLGPKTIEEALPAGWAWKRLDELALIVSGGTPSRAEASFSRCSAYTLISFRPRAEPM
jgi:type I restriction enzyme S subunit